MNKQNNNDTIRTEPEAFITKEMLAILVIVILLLPRWRQWSPTVGYRR